jgi:hypothetical protein
MEDVDGEFFSGFPVGRDSHHQSEDDAMSPVIQRMQRELVARGNRLDERRPILLRHRSLGLGIEHVAECGRPLLFYRQIRHWPRSWKILRRSIKTGDGRYAFCRPTAP